MDINKEMYIWVDTIFQRREKGEIVFDGNSFDDELGFGVEKRKFEGEFLQVSMNEKIKDNGRIDMIHYSHFGLKWIVHNSGSFLEAPFLITSNMSINHIYGGTIHLTTSYEAEMAIKKYPNYNFAIVSKSCIGNLYVNEKSAYIDVFSDKKFVKRTDFLTEDFCFAGYDKCIGRIDI